MGKKFTRDEIKARINELCREMAYEQQYIDRIEAVPELKKGIAANEGDVVDAAYWIENDIWGNAAAGFINRLHVYMLDQTWGKPLAEREPTDDVGYNTTNSIIGDIALRVIEKLREEFPEKPESERIEGRVSELAEKLIDQLPLAEKLAELLAMDAPEHSQSECIQNTSQVIFLNAYTYTKKGKWPELSADPQQDQLQRPQRQLFYDITHELHEGIMEQLREEFPEKDPNSRVSSELSERRL